MDWGRVLDTFNDELEKIAEFDLRGMSPETVLSTGQPRQPMPSAAYDKALQILDRASMQPMAKTADVVAESTQIKRDPYVHKIRPIGKAALTGAAAGGLGASMFGGMKATRLGIGAGAALGVADRLYTNRQKAKLKKHAMISPGMQLRASKAVGVPKNILHTGKSVRSQISGSLIGRKFTPPTL